MAARGNLRVDAAMPVTDRRSSICRWNQGRVVGPSEPADRAMKVAVGADQVRCRCQVGGQPRLELVDSRVVEFILRSPIEMGRLVLARLETPGRRRSTCRVLPAGFIRFQPRDGIRRGFRERRLERTRRKRPSSSGPDSVDAPAPHPQAGRSSVPSRAYKAETPFLLKGSLLDPRRRFTRHPRRREAARRCRDQRRNTGEGQEYIAGRYRFPGGA